MIRCNNHAMRWIHQQQDTRRRAAITECLQHVNDRFIVTFHNHVGQVMLKDGIVVLVASAGFLYSNKEPISLSLNNDGGGGGMFML